MKYLKKYKIFESYTSDIIDNRDDIIRVLSEHVGLYDDGLVHELVDLGFTTIADDMIEDILNSGDPINREIITIIVDDISNSNSQRDASKLLDIYVDAKYYLDNSDPNTINNLRDIFADYLDDKKAQIYKTSDKHDNRYVVLIDQIDVLLDLDFKEIINRVKDIVGLKYMSYSGVSDQIKFEFHEPYPNDED